MDRDESSIRTARGMTVAAIVPLTLLAMLSACDPGTTSAISPGMVEFGAGRGGVPGGPGGGGGSAQVELAGGVTTPGLQQAPIATNNNKRLTLDTPSEDSEMYASTFALTSTHGAGLTDCEIEGSFDGSLTPEDLLDVMVEASRFRDFTLYIDKDDAAAGAVSDYQQLKQTWHTDSPSLRFVTFIGFKNKRARLPGVSDPVVMASDEGGGTTLYEFQGGTGIVAIDELHEGVGILCALLDDVDVRVTITP